MKNAFGELDRAKKRISDLEAITIESSKNWVTKEKEHWQKSRIEYLRTVRQLQMV